MKFYQNKNSGEIIGIENMREVIDIPTKQSVNCGYRDYSYHIVYDMICPNRLIPNGINSFCISHSFLTLNYKRINKNIAFSKYPIFKQYDYEDLEKEAIEKNKTTLEIIKQQTF